MSIQEFRDAGYLQEVNRRFLHPLGMALSVRVERGCGTEFDGVFRTDDPEGFIFDGCDDETRLDSEKAKAIDASFKLRCLFRQTRLGFGVQPIRE